MRTPAPLEPDYTEFVLRPVPCFSERLKSIAGRHDTYVTSNATEWLYGISFATAYKLLIFAFGTFLSARARRISSKKDRYKRVLHSGADLDFSGHVLYEMEISDTACIW